IGAVPDHLTTGGQIRLIADEGTDSSPKTCPSCGTIEQKEEAELQITKSRTDVVTLEPPLGTSFAISPTPPFPEQPQRTSGPPAAVTITNNGFTSLNEVDITSVGVTSTQGTSADDFLLSNDTCEGATLTEGESCTVDVRYSPSGDQPTSDAQLVIKGNL